MSCAPCMGIRRLESIPAWRASSTLPWQAAAPGRERRRATAAVLLALVVAAFETTVVTTAMPTLTAELDGRALYAWVFTGFLLASTVGVLLGGRLSDRLGRRGTFVAGMGLFLLGSVLCGFSTSVPMLVAFRVLQGLGAGAVQPTTLTISSDLYTLEERAAIQSLFTGAWGLASVVGPVVGGLLTEHLGWRSVFWVNVPVGTARRRDAAALVPRPAPARLAALRARRSRPRGAVHDPGAARARAAGAPRARPSLVVVLAAALAAWAFVRQQRRSTDPLVPPAVLRDRTVRSGLVGGLVSGGVLYTLSAYVPAVDDVARRSLRPRRGRGPGSAPHRVGAGQFLRREAPAPRRPARLGRPRVPRGRHRRGALRPRALAGRLRRLALCLAGAARRRPRAGGEHLHHRAAGARPLGAAGRHHQRGLCLPNARRQPRHRGGEPPGGIRAPADPAGGGHRGRRCARPRAARSARGGRRTGGAGPPVLE